MNTVATKRFAVRKDFTKEHATPFSEEDIEFIRENYLSKSDLYIGHRLGRSKDAIRSKRQHLDLLKYKCSNVPYQPVDRWSLAIEEEIHALVNFIEITKSPTLREIANTRRKELVAHLNR